MRNETLLCRCMMQNVTPSDEPPAVMLPAPESFLVKVIGEGALGSVGSRADRWKNLHNITSHCTRPDVKIREIPKTPGGG